MPSVHSDDAEIVYQIRGRGPAVILLHPFPAHHEFWYPLLPALESRYHLILPDLRGHGDSGIGAGPAFIGKHAADVARVMDAVGVEKAAFIGCSIGGYVIFEFLRRYGQRVSAVVLIDTRPQPDAPEARANRLKSAETVLEQGTEQFLQSLVPKLMCERTISARPDLVEGALRMMRKMSPEDISQVQRGMAERVDSVPDLKRIEVPTLIMRGAEDSFSNAADSELMREHISGSQVRTIPKAGHYAPWEQPEAVAPLLRQFLDSAVLR
jgi:pimeloyl-ACP methyl ester carboxylesterase